MDVEYNYDMKFLQDSWANLAEVDEDQIRTHQQAQQDVIAAEADIDKQISQEVQAHIDKTTFQTYGAFVPLI